MTPAPKETSDGEDTRTKNVEMPSKETGGVSNHVDDDTIKIERPKQKADAMAMPSLGATAAAKTVNNKETVKLRPSAAAQNAPAGDDAAAKASKATIKLSPPSAAKTKEEPKATEDKKDEAGPTVNLKIDRKPKSKLTIGKAPPPKTVAKEEEEAAPEGQGGGLKLKSMAPKTEAPRAAADQQKIKEKKTGKKREKSSASPFYTAVAVITVVLVAFSALATTSQFFDLWEPESPVGKQIVPHVKGIMDSLMKSLIK